MTTPVQESRLVLLESLADRAVDMLFAAAGALHDKEMPKLSSAVSEFACEMNERIHGESAP